VRCPHVAWLQVFRLPYLKESEEQKAKRRRSANRLAGLEIVCAGLVLPLLYFVSTVMMFNEPRTVDTIISRGLLDLVRGRWHLGLHAELLAVAETWFPVRGVYRDKTRVAAKCL